MKYYLPFKAISLNFYCRKVYDLIELWLYINTYIYGDYIFIER